MHGAVRGEGWDRRRPAGLGGGGATGKSTSAIEGERRGEGGEGIERRLGWEKRETASPLLKLVRYKHNSNLTDILCGNRRGRQTLVRGWATLTEGQGGCVR